MPRAKTGASKSAIFRDFFERHPHLLDDDTNDEIFRLFKEENPNIDLDKSWQGVCANVKSNERKKHGKMKRKPRKRGRKPAAKVGSTNGRRTRGKASPAAAEKAPVDVTRILESLEENIDTWLSTVRDADPKGSDAVVKYLRRARNLVSHRLDEMEDA